MLKSRGFSEMEKYNFYNADILKILCNNQHKLNNNSFRSAANSAISKYLLPIEQLSSLFYNSVTKSI